ncbi:ABC transporter permease [Tahibacter amnicola]|uniref:ABC transporter permease n=1 Tax=Tahibacter amnicola TaxID=2976241 RepID=A0ABY6BFH6_9GAMM|nr:ABC transporter permease [Tahibacter amnicola]UXI68779.1 ABC transporter permease [Tahibacter amnicola]
MKTILVVFLKEVLENLRDRRTVLNALVFVPLLSPLVFMAIVKIELTRRLDQGEKTLEVSVIGAENAPNLVGFLKQQGLRIKPPVADPEAAVRQRDEDVVVRIPASYAPSWKEGAPAQVDLVFDASQRDAMTSVERMRALLQAYSGQHAAVRLLVRGINPTIATPVVVASRDVSTPQSRGEGIFGMLPYLLVVASFVGGMYLAIDTTAGERERQSLEPLLANPVPRSSILAGKLAATVAFAFASLTLTVIGFGLAGLMVPSEAIGVHLNFGPSFVFTVLLAMVPLVLLASCLQTLVAAFAKSYREAQTYLTLLMLIPTLNAMLLVITPSKAVWWMYAVPLLGQHHIVTHLVRGESVTAAQLGLCLAGGMAAALVCWLVTERVYQSEKLAVSA